MSAYSLSCTCIFRLLQLLRSITRMIKLGKFFFGNNIHLRFLHFVPIIEDKCLSLSHILTSYMQGLWFCNPPEAIHYPNCLPMAHLIITWSVGFRFFLRIARIKLKSAQLYMSQIVKASTYAAAWSSLLLFLSFVNDVAVKHANNKCTCQLHADDLKLCTTVNADHACNKRKPQERLNDL